LNKNNNRLHLLSRCALVAQEVATNSLRLETEGLKASREANKLAKKVQSKHLGDMDTELPDSGVV
jgi:hypothetical protein